MTRDAENRILRLTPLFEGMTDAEISEALRLYRAERVSYIKGETLISIGSPVDRFALVLSGSVQVMSDDLMGQHMIMITVEPGTSFAESLCFRKCRESPVYACAFTNCEIMWLHTDALEHSTGLCLRFIRLLTGKTLSMNNRVQVLSKLTIREKLLTLLSQYASKDGSRFTIPFDRDSLAAYLGTNRSALSRELSRMREDGLIEYERNIFRVK